MLHFLYGNLNFARGENCGCVPAILSLTVMCDEFDVNNHEAPTLEGNVDCNLIKLNLIILLASPNNN